MDVVNNCPMKRQSTCRAEFVEKQWMELTTRRYRGKEGANPFCRAGADLMSEELAGHPVRVGQVVTHKTLC
jgi:hypothetical protein